MGRYLLAALFVLTGCTTSQESVTGPSGGIVHQAKCSGSPNGCLNEAGKTCAGPYQVLASSSNAGGLVADVLPGPVTWYNMSYQCGSSDGKMPSFDFRGGVYRAPVQTTTTCNKFGQSVTCRSY